MLLLRKKNNFILYVLHFNLRKIVPDSYLIVIILFSVLLNGIEMTWMTSLNYEMIFLVYFHAHKVLARQSLIKHLLNHRVCF
jgi:hypothetical protein